MLVLATFILIVSVFAEQAKMANSRGQVCFLMVTIMKGVILFGNGYYC